MFHTTKTESQWETIDKYSLLRECFSASGACALASYACHYQTKIPRVLRYIDILTFQISMLVTSYMGGVMKSMSVCKQICVQMQI